ncbi:hypothetical protein QAD02_020542 [Eretmocerus hayati]|uniref:Uncharacterized protein n=1 Tax=Eretmocerus hayati TaxID=131215 RepID=A0ACC2PN76_9HYME|nr:hypothetical protein QAD02_020542 [Eretmocerus hayati]
MQKYEWMSSRSSEPLYHIRLVIRAAGTQMLRTICPQSRGCAARDKLYTSPAFIAIVDYATECIRIFTVARLDGRVGRPQYATSSQTVTARCRYFEILRQLAPLDLKMHHIKSEVKNQRK